MGMATFLIGVLPTYDQVAKAAPVLLIACDLSRALASAENGAAPC